MEELEDLRAEIDFIHMQYALLRITKGYLEGGNIDFVNVPAYCDAMPSDVSDYGVEMGFLKKYEDEEYYVVNAELWYSLYNSLMKRIAICGFDMLSPS